MLNKRHEIAQSIARELIPAERDIDAAILRNARLTIAVVEGRKEAKMPLDAGQEGLDLIAKANVSLVEARGHIVDAHFAFRKTQAEAGLDNFCYGDSAECPPPSAVRLRSVA